MSLSTQQENNIRQWISEYPDIAWIFQSPEFVHMFANYQPVREDSEEWLATVKQLAHDFG